MSIAVIVLPKKIILNFILLSDVLPNAWGCILNKTNPNRELLKSRRKVGISNLSPVLFQWNIDMISLQEVQLILLHYMVRTESCGPFGPLGDQLQCLNVCSWLNSISSCPRAQS